MENTSNKFLQKAKELFKIISNENLIEESFMLNSALVKGVENKEKDMEKIVEMEENQKEVGIGPPLMTWNEVIRDTAYDENPIEISEASRINFENELECDENDLIATDTMIINKNMESYFNEAFDIGDLEREECLDRDRDREDILIKDKNINENIKQNRRRILKYTTKSNVKYNKFIPDHIRHPEKYTCYTLDEPIYIGGNRKINMDNKVIFEDQVDKSMISNEFNIFKHKIQTDMKIDTNIIDDEVVLSHLNDKYIGRINSEINVNNDIDEKNDNSNIIVKKGKRNYRKK